ncbi:MAG: DUF1501 domain-containing protein, partial [Planctomycetota bacterium]|nr:DUF1501 domain-containing protein [Planctomycetota bacterium]
MLTLFDSSEQKDCTGRSRRDFLCAGTLALGSLTLPDLLAAKDRFPSAFVRDRSVVLLYLSGGASHIETFDPKMEAPAGNRSVTGSVQTNISGVQFGGTFSRLARHAKNLSVVRSFQHPVGGHEQAHVHVLSGGTNPRGDQKEGFSMGSLVSRIRGANDPDTGLPTYSLLTEPEIDGQYRKELGRVRKGSWPGTLGAPYMPFEPGVGGKAMSNMSLNIPSERFGERTSLLKSLDDWKRTAERDFAGTGTNKFTEQAFDLLVGGSTDALDLSKEDPKLVELYDTSQIQIGHKKFRPSTLGKQMLMARRLCESGCKFVTVHSAGWDMHADGNNPGMVKGMDMLGRTLDQAVSTFLQDVGDRGLSNKILLVITGDFGRTPKMNEKGGRDHWAKLCTLAFAGGGLNMGQIVGRSSRDAGEPASEPYNASHLMG